MPHQYVNAVYYPSWRIYKGLPPSSLNVDAVTHVFYAFVRVNEDGSLRHLDEHADLSIPADGETGCLAALAALKRRHPHLKTLISVGGGSGSAEFPALAASAAASTRLAHELRDFVGRHELDGVDIDWEHPTTPQEGSDFSQLLHALRAALPAPHHLLTAALPVGEYCLRHLDLPQAARHLDQLNLMGYDFTGAWTDVSGHHAQLHSPGPGPGRGGGPDAVHPTLRRSCASGVAYVLARGFPAARVSLGVPAYARHFAGARAPGHPFRGAGETDYRDLPARWVRGARVDAEAGAASFVDEEGGVGFVSFDTPATVGMKARFVRAQGLAGLFYWTGVGDRGGDESLVLAGHRELAR